MYIHKLIHADKILNITFMCFNICNVIVEKYNNDKKKNKKKNKKFMDDN
jgi:hypothetical protein